ncbi:JmjC domain-containing histone demethylation protein 1 [Vanrija albida]|uniref:[histone H3]-dimethyl-L-lysine(36) demethylase n=1 Tax=Vanrija albida TaxID=181172 RepID=A0ABR3PZG8_9TREE
MARAKGKEEPETCALCPSSGQPAFSAAPSTSDNNNNASPDQSPDLQWIACGKCKKWYHSVCVLQSSEEWAATVPQELRDQAEASTLGAWFDWPAPVNKWYCLDCIAFSTSPSNPKPPRQPLAATLKKPRKRASGSAASPTRKRPRASSTEAAPEPVGTGVDAPRPKRKAALDRPDYWNMHNHIATPTKNWLDLIKDPKKYGRVIKPDNFPRVPGALLRREWVDSGASPSNADTSDPTSFPPTLFYGPTREPLVVTQAEGGLTSMGGMVPDPSLTVDDVARLVGPDKLVDVIDVATQHSSQWTLAKWAAYLKAKADPSAAGPSKVYNIISLEISGSELAQLVRPPMLVADVDWVENYWHFPGGKEATMRAAAKKVEDEVETNGDAEEGKPRPRPKNDWPKVQLYCLMGMKDSWTDWHVDFAASSVYYNVHTGSKVFFFIRPTEANLAAYAQWSGSHELQSNTWLPDMCDEVRKVTLTAGDTMIIPAGYIHAVFTPMDSIVFGGNFVHSYDIPTQLRMRQIEIDTKVPQRFRFPFFEKLCWYVAEKHVSDLRALRTYRPGSKPPAVTRPVDRVLRGLVVLARFLIEQVRTMENPNTDDKQRRLIWNRIPNEVQDAGGLAHELLWRVEQELPDSWEDEEEVKVEEKGSKGRKKKALGASNGSKQSSQPREQSQQPREPSLQLREKSLQLLDKPASSRTWRFSPSPWEQEDNPIVQDRTTIMLARPGGSELEEAEQVEAVYRQRRRRTHTEDGELVLEEQDLVFTERRTIWIDAPVKAEVNGHGDA